MWTLVQISDRSALSPGRSQEEDEIDVLVPSVSKGRKCVCVCAHAYVHAYVRVNAFDTGLNGLTGICGK